MANVEHNTRDNASLHPFARRSESDPGAIGAGKGWFKLSTGELKVRNAADSGWVTIVDPNLAAHLADTSDAHDASAISFVPAGTVAATTVQAAIEEVASEGGGGGGSDDQTASEVPFTPTGAVAATNVQTAIAELDTEKATTGSVTTVQTNLDNHTGDATDAHDASAISYAGGTGMSATDVEAAVDELATEKANASDLTAHTGDTVDAHDASAISFSPTGTIAATDVQGAIAEVATEASGADDQTASEVPFTPAGTIAATNVQTAIEEVASEASGGGYTPPWVKTGSNVVYAAWADGNPGPPTLIPPIGAALANQVTATLIGTSRAILVKFRIPKALAVTAFRVWPAGNYGSGVIQFAIYRVSDGTRMWTSGNFSMTNANWVALTGLSFSLAADTDYWLAISATTTSSTAAFNAIPVHSDTDYWGASSGGPLAGLAAGLPEYAQVAVTSGVLPSPLPTLADAAVGPGVPPAWLTGTAS